MEGESKMKGIFLGLISIVLVIEGTTQIDTNFYAGVLLFSFAFVIATIAWISELP